MRGLPEDKSYEQSLMTLARLLVRRDNYRLAAARLQELLDRFPDQGRALDYRFQLAECYRRIAEQEDQKLLGGARVTEEAQLHHRDERRRWLQMAAANYQKIVDDFGIRQSEGRLSTAEGARIFVWPVSPSPIANLSLAITGAPSPSTRISPRYPTRGEALTALKQIVRCYWVQRDQAKAENAISRIRAPQRPTRVGLQWPVGHANPKGMGGVARLGRQTAIPQRNPCRPGRKPLRTAQRSETFALTGAKKGSRASPAPLRRTGPRVPWLILPLILGAPNSHSGAK